MSGDIDRHIQALYEIPSLTDALRDEAATVLLQWAEAQVLWLAMGGQSTGDTLEENCQTLQTLMKRLGRLVGGRPRQTPEEQQAAMNLVIEAARTLGYHTTAADIETFLAQPPAGEVEDLQALLALLKTSDSGSDSLT